MKVLKEADVILGVKFRLKTENRFYLNQSHYTENLLKKFNCFNNTCVRT